ncbi:MAG: hypothetical protein Q8P40_14240 [Nitrospirota bacterium]|nr:hypothetical protein [Nitrospirota bacterium]
MNDRRPEGFEEVEKRVNKFYYIGGFIGAFVFFVLLQSFWGLLLGTIIGCIISGILHSTTADKTMKTKIRDYNIYQRKQQQEQKTRDLNREENLNIKCPTCGSSSIDRISTGKKLAYIATFGILAPAFKKVRSQFQCRECRYKW